MISISNFDDPSKSKEKLFYPSENSTRVRSELSSKGTRGGLVNLPGFEILHISNHKQKSCICSTKQKIHREPHHQKELYTRRWGAFCFLECNLSSIVITVYGGIFASICFENFSVWIEIVIVRRSLVRGWVCVQVLRPEEHIGMSAVAFEGKKGGPHLTVSQLFYSIPEFFVEDVPIVVRNSIFCLDHYFNSRTSNAKTIPKRMW